MTIALYASQGLLRRYPRRCYQSAWIMASNRAIPATLQPEWYLLSWSERTNLLRGEASALQRLITAGGTLNFSVYFSDGCVCSNFTDMHATSDAVSIVTLWAGWLLSLVFTLRSTTSILKNLGYTINTDEWKASKWESMWASCDDWVWSWISLFEMRDTAAVETYFEVQTLGFLGRWKLIIPTLTTLLNLDIGF